MKVARRGVGKTLLEDGGDVWRSARGMRGGQKKVNKSASEAATRQARQARWQLRRAEPVDAWMKEGEWKEGRFSLSHFGRDKRKTDAEESGGSREKGADFASRPQ